MTTCGEMLVGLLEAYGIDTVFGIPGVHTVELYRGLPDTRIRHITPRHEQGAGFMADGYARACGRPAACFIITGPGLTNIATALGQAYADSVPLLVISSVNNTHELGLGEGRLHELPSQRNLMAGLTAFSHTLLRPDELPEVLARAFAVFHAVRPRPVHIELPLDVITTPADHVPRQRVAPVARPAPAPDVVAAAAELLRGARRPLVLLGGGARDAAPQARALVERLGALTVTTINGKGILPPEHPLCMGSTLSQPPVLEELAAADVVLAVGTELGETDTLLFDGRLTLGGRLIRIDIDPGQLTRNALPEVAILGDAGLALQALELELEDHEVDTVPVAARAQVLREQSQSLLDGRQRLHQRFMAAVQQALPGVIMVGDSTQPVYSANLFYRARAATLVLQFQHRLRHPGLRAAGRAGRQAGQSRAAGGGAVGDGGLQFTVGELATAVELAVPLPILLWNNRGYGEIKRYMAERGIPQIGVDIYTPDFLTIARGFGCRADRVESLKHLRWLLHQARSGGGANPDRDR